jgi:hypothetical protein
MLDPELEAALDRMYEDALYKDEALELWDGPDAPQTGETLWLSPGFRAYLAPEPSEWSNIDTSGFVIVLDELDYVKSNSTSNRLLWVKVLTTEGVGWVRGAFLCRVYDSSR